MGKRLLIFGSTGSIGRNCLEVVSRYGDKFQIVGLSAGNNIDLLAQQAAQFGVSFTAIPDENRLNDLRKILPAGTQSNAGDEAAEWLLDKCAPLDLVVNAMVGVAGLRPSLETLKRDITLALANKESLVAGGALVLKTLDTGKARLLPIDSEHSAIFQCLLGEDRKTIRELILTASGGPFLDTPRKDFPSITPQMALRHPNWQMGARITIDSATMVNKGLEVIEAHWLFGIPAERIKVVIHRQSIIHSLVRFDDGSYLAQLGAPDMRLPIQFALTYPERLYSPYCDLNFEQAFNLSFQPLPAEKFPGLLLAYAALREGGLYPTALNAADETAVAAFLAGKISFIRIPQLVEKALEWMAGNENMRRLSEYSLEDILTVDGEVRKYVEMWIRDSELGKRN